MRTAEHDFGAAILMNTFKHLRIQQDQQGIIWLGIDVQNEKTNALNIEVIHEFSAITQRLANLEAVGVVVYSAKPGIFVTGVDLTALLSFEKADDVLKLLELGQEAIDAFANLNIPTVAIIDGACFSTGIEIMLGCTYRIASTAPHTIFGCPELKAGLHLGASGTVRIMNHLGSQQALKLMLEGHPISATEALDKGLIDVLCAPEQLYIAARHTILKPPALPTIKRLNFLTDNSLVRPLIRKYWQKKLQECGIHAMHYPAPYALLDLWSLRGQGHTTKALYQAEAASVAKLLFNPPSRHLIRLFFLQNRLKAISNRQRHHVQHVHIIGVGIMGRDIAAWCASQGLNVTFQDKDPKAIEHLLLHAKDFILKAQRGKTKQVDTLLSYLKADPQGKGIARADLIIEAIPDKLADKQELLAMLEEQTHPDALLVTTTSSLAFDKLAGVLLKPERLVGLHFLNPLIKLPLVEVVHQAHVTGLDWTNKACSFVRQIDKLPLLLKSSPGYLINRILFVYIFQGIRLYQQGVPNTLLDKAGTDFGMPLGPLMLADRLGLDYCRQMGELLAKHSSLTLPTIVMAMTKEGKLGRKSGAGFYRYRQGRRLKPERQHWEGSQIALQEKLIHPMLEEAAICLEQGIIEDPDLLDMAVVSGTGFAPFLGGPLNYARSLRQESLAQGEHL